MILTIDHVHLQNTLKKMKSMIQHYYNQNKIIRYYKKGGSLTTPKHPIWPHLNFPRGMAVVTAKVPPFLAPTEGTRKVQKSGCVWTTIVNLIQNP